MTDHPPTPEQTAIIDAACGPGNLMVTAYAGCGKTTTLVSMAQALPRDTAGLALAFNVKIAKELSERFPDNFTVKTMNGLGHKAWSSAIGKFCKVDDRKLGRLVTSEARKAGIELGDDWDEVRQLVSAAMLSGIVPAKYSRKGLLPDTLANWKDLGPVGEPTDNMVELSRGVLIASIEEAFAGTISYDDQIYMPTMFEGSWPRYPLVMVDEAQDLSPLNHIMVQRVAAGRLIVVGDPKQAIYAFRGADSQSMSKLRALRKEWIDLPLHQTFRCPRVLVQRAESHAPGFRAHESNAEGRITDLRGHATKENPAGIIPTWNWSMVPPGEAFVLCRNTAPLLSLAFKLIRQGTGVVMMGRDIGKGLVALSKKIVPKADASVAECKLKITEWMETECDTLRANGKEEKVSAVQDRGECLLAVCEAEGVRNAGDLRKRLEDLFARDRGSVTLATIHRSKGLERDVVVHLDPWRIPSKYAKRALSLGDPSQMEQEKNLRYVCETRAKRELVLANLEDFR